MYSKHMTFYLKLKKHPLKLHTLFQYRHSHAPTTKLVKLFDKIITVKLVKSNGEIMIISICSPPVQTIYLLNSMQVVENQAVGNHCLISFPCPNHSKRNHNSFIKKLTRNQNFCRQAAMRRVKAKPFRITSLYIVLFKARFNVYSSAE